jgi:hypothetical protein
MERQLIMLNSSVERTSSKNIKPVFYAKMPVRIYVEDA